MRGIGTEPRHAVLGFMVASGFLSMWISNTVAVVLMPVAASVIAMVEEVVGPGEATRLAVATAVDLVAWSRHLRCTRDYRPRFSAIPQTAPERALKLGPALLLFLALVVGGGLAIGYFTVPGERYSQLVKPDFNPPGEVFGPVWTVLYVLIAIAGWRVWQRDSAGLPMRLWWGQLALNSSGRRSFSRPI